MDETHSPANESDLYGRSVQGACGEWEARNCFLFINGPRPMDNDEDIVCCGSWRRLCMFS